MKHPWVLGALCALLSACSKDASTPAEEKAAPLAQSAPDAPAPPPAAPASEDQEALEEEMDELRPEEAKPSRSQRAPAKDAFDRKGAKQAEKKKELSRDLDGDGDLAGLEAQLASLEGQMRQAGVPVPTSALGGASAGGEAAADATTTAAPLNCEKACELTDAICGLADNICAMKERHADDPRYVNACERATRDCTLGRSTCEGCAS